MLTLICYSMPVFHALCCCCCCCSSHPTVLCISADIVLHSFAYILEIIKGIVGFESYYLSFVLSLAPFAWSRYHHHRRRRCCRCCSSKTMFYFWLVERIHNEIRLQNNAIQNKNKCEGLWLIAICYKVMLLILFFFPSLVHTYICMCVFKTRVCLLVHILLRRRKKNMIFSAAAAAYSLLHS